MSKIQKLIDGMRNNPRAVRFEDLDKVMTRHGFASRQFGTSHVTYTKSAKRATVAKPHGNSNLVKVVYVLQCLEAIQGEELDGD